MSKIDLRQCPLCLSDDLEVVFGHDCPYDINKRGKGSMLPGVNIDAPERGNGDGSGKGRGGNSPAKATPAQISYAISLGLPEHIALAMTKASASDHIERLLEQRKSQGVSAPVKMASEKQKNFIRNLLSERPGAWDGDVNSLSLDDASNLIKRLLATPKSQAPKANTPVANEVGEGFYQDSNGVIYKVQIAVHGSGKPYAKTLDTETGKFEYAPGAIRKLSKARKLTLEEAKELGHLYGRCIVCGRTLTDEYSIANGIGPVCAKRF